jgi:von Willebrand factor type A domain
VNATVAGVGVPCVSSMTNGGLAPRSAGTAIWDAIHCGIEAVSRDAETPRRVVLVFTDGVDNASVLRPQDVERYAAQFGVMVYAIGIPAMYGIDYVPLRTLAEDTGGGYFTLLDRDDLPRTFARVAEELRHQCVFGVTPAGDGSAHKLDVRVRRADAIARARRV